MDGRPDGGRVASDPYCDAAPWPISLSARRVAAALDSAAAAQITIRVTGPVLPGAVPQPIMCGASRRASARRSGSESGFAKEFQLAANSSLGEGPGYRVFESVLA